MKGGASSYFFLEKSCTSTSRTVLSRPMLAPLYRPTMFSHMLTITTSAVASENSALFRSKSYRHSSILDQNR